MDPENLPFDQAIRRAARRTAVRVLGSLTNGSGFFARPGVVLTCAHVVGDDDLVTVEWNDGQYIGQVVERYPAAPGTEPSGMWSFPDIAVIRLKSPPDHPVPFFADVAPVEGEQLLAYGFVEGTLQPGPQRDGVLLTTTAAAGDYQRVKDDRVVSGLSGAMVMSVRTGLVVGMVKASLDPRVHAGGWVTLGRALTEALDRSLDPEPAELGKLDPVWTDALLSPIRAVLKGQVVAGAALPYRLLEPPVPPLSQVYVRQQANDGHQSIDVAEMLAGHRHALLVGLPGSGKTSLVQQICSSSAQWWLDRTATPPYGMVIPVRAQASSFTKDRPFLESLAVSVERDVGLFLDVPLPAGLFTRTLLPGVPWLIMVDGLDEVIDPEQRSAILAAIDQRVSEADPTLRIVVTTRPLLETDLAYAREVARFDLLLFEQPQLEQFARHWFTARHEVVGADSAAAAEEIALRFVRQVNAADIDSLAAVPLLLTIAAIIFERSPSGELPPTISALFEQFVELVLARRGMTQPDGEAISAHASWIWEERASLLEATAFRWFFESDQPIFDVALQVLTNSQRRAIADTPQLRRFLWTVLHQSGLVTVAGSTVSWIHLSLAEYLASRVLARKTTPEQWTWLAARPPTANIARLALVHVARSKGLSVDFVERLLSQDSAALSLRELLGTPGLLSSDVIRRLTHTAERRGRLSSAPFAATPAGAAVLRDAARTAPTLSRRLKAAEALLAAGSTLDARAGVDALHHAATAGPATWRQRLGAVNTLVNAARRRGDGTEFAEDVALARRRAAAILRRRRLLPGQKARTVLEWPAISSPDMRHTLLAGACHSRWTSRMTRVAAAAALASEYGELDGVDVLIAVAGRTTRFRFRPKEGLEWLGTALGMVSLCATILGVLATNGVTVIELGVVSSIFLVGIFAIAFSPWWRRSTRSGEQAQKELRRLARGAHGSVSDRAAQAPDATAWTTADYLDHLTFISWIRRKHVRDRADVLVKTAMFGMRAQHERLFDGYAARLGSEVSRLASQGQDMVFDELRRQLTQRSVLDRWIVWRKGYRIAYENPRSARPVLVLLLSTARAGSRAHRRAATLLNVLGGEDDF